MIDTRQSDVEVLHEDDICYAVMPRKGAVAGHIIIRPKKEYCHLREIPDTEVKHLFYVASFAATAVFEVAGAQGTNIIMHEGAFSGRPLELHVIPRTTEDSLDFHWEPKQLGDDEMESALSALRDKAFYIGKEKPEDTARKGAKQKDTEEGKETQPREETEKMIIEGEGEDYRIKQLRRIP